jgi:MoaA/NifB/PqqE/SkfB family radical SAM enzyme
MAKDRPPSKAPFPWASERFRKPAAPQAAITTCASGWNETAPPLMGHPSKLFIELTTRCTLACPMCVKQSPGSGILPGDMPREIFHALHFTCWQKNVTARVFGNLKEKGILEIWNDPSFVAFRTEALGNEYPYCSNCNLVPCDYLTADEFERDCFDTSVPCGDCFWGLGIFNCLR